MIWKLLLGLGETRLADRIVSDASVRERAARQGSDLAGDVLGPELEDGSGAVAIRAGEAGESAGTSATVAVSGRASANGAGDARKTAALWSIPYIDQPMSFWEAIRSECGTQIQEVYLPLCGVGNLSGRPRQPDAYLDEFMAQAPFPYSLLINPIVFPRPVEQIGDEIVSAVAVLRSSRLRGVTVSSVSLAERLKRSFPDLPITASVLMDIGSRSQIPLLCGAFDAVVPSSSIVRDVPALRALRAAFKGKIRLIVNEGCLPQCCFRTQHFFEMAQGTHFPASLCAEVLEKEPWLRLTGAWILPPFLKFYEGICDEFKLAGRVTLQDPAAYKRVLGAYVRREEITPDSIGGGPALPLEPIKISEAFFQHTLTCGKECFRCGFCREYASRARG
jgi:hypothetical protein